MSMSVARVLLGRSASVVAARAPRQRPYRRRRRTAPVAGTRTSSSNAGHEQQQQQQQQASDQAHQDSAGFPHVSVMLDEVLAAFEGRPVRTFIDGTLGAGGHSSALAAAHPEMRKLVGLDVDPTAHALAGPRIAAAAASSELEVDLRLSNFSRLEEQADAAGVLASGGADGILLDLGVSSMQLDDRSRGFSFLSPDERADMRMDPQSPLDAATLVNTWSEDEIGRVLREYGEERRWRSLAARLVRARSERGAPIETVGELITAMGLPLDRRRGRDKIHPATRAFQGIRIAVNGELDVLKAVLPQAMRALAPGGRLAIISFHSLEDRMVKRAFREAEAQTKRPSAEAVAAGFASEPPPRDTDWPDDLPRVRLVNRKAAAPSKNETEGNKRARSAKLRVLERLPDE